MGFFDKIKKAVGKTGVELEYRWIEDPLTFTDPMVKATVTVKSPEGAFTVLGTSAKLVAKRPNDETGEEELILGESTETADPNATTERNGEWVPVFPHTIQAGESEDFGIWIDDLDLPAKLAAWGATDAESAREAGISMFVVTEVDIKETNFMFDPTIEQEIQLG